MKWSILTLLLLLCLVPVLAQDECPAFVPNILQSVEDTCTDLSRNQACYGNAKINTVAREGVADFTFESSGDIANIGDIELLELESLSLTEETWGIALLKLQANLPDTLPGQNVLMVLFGNVDLETPAERDTGIPMTSTGNINVRLRPTTSENNVLLALQPSQVVTGIGRLEDNAWVYIAVDEETNGWVSASLLNTEDDIQSLPIIAPSEATTQNVQGYYFSSGIGDRPCTQAPDSGILLQTPEGASTVKLSINGVKIELGSTAYLQAGNGVMTITLIEGSADITVNRRSLTVPAGTYVEIPLTDDGRAPLDTQLELQSYDRETLEALPLSLLEREIEIAEPLTAEEIDALSPQIPVGGAYIGNGRILEACAGDPFWQVRDPGNGINFTVVVNDNGESVVLTPAGGQTYFATRVGEGSYSGSGSGGQLRYTVTFPTPTSFIFTSTATSPQSSCSPSVQITGQLVG